MPKAKQTPTKRLKPKIVVEAFEYGLLNVLEGLVKDEDVGHRPMSIDIGGAKWALKIVHKEQESHSDYDSNWEGFAVFEAQSDGLTEYVRIDLQFSSYSEFPTIMGGIAAARLVTKVPVTVFKWEDVS